MDQKRAMLYPQVDFSAPTAPENLQEQPQLPTEAPPSYDVAISSPIAPPVSSPVSSPAPVLVVTGQPLPTLVQTAPSNLGPNPCSILCPACGAQETSRMTHTANNRTHLGAGLLCLVGWCCCACFVPYCMNSCRTGNHYCAQCNTFLGVYQPSPSPSRPSSHRPAHRRRRSRS